MKKIYFFLMSFLISFPVFAVDSVVDTQLIDQIEDFSVQKHMNYLQQYKDQINYKMGSCDQMDTVIKTMLEGMSNNRYYGGTLGGDFMLKSQVSMDSAVPASEMGGGTTVPSPHFSQTNLQVQGVDEPEMLKSDGKYLYYINTNQGYIFIVESPVVSWENAKVIKKIKFPVDFNPSNLFLYNNKLIILGDRYHNDISLPEIYIDRNQRTTVAIYDLADINNLRLEKLFDVDGSFYDARITNGNLYLISHFNLYIQYPYQKYQYADIVANVDTKKILPMYVDYTSAGINSYRASCDDFVAVLPQDELLKKKFWYPSFTIVSRINLSQLSQKPSSTVVLGNTETVYMSQKSLILLSSFNDFTSMKCSAFAPCPLIYQNESLTVAHKFGLQSSNNALSYDGSAIVSGQPLTQWSVNEHSNGNVFMLTKTFSPSLATHLFSLTPQMNIQGMLTNIEPGEQFQASRYIGNYLYLVTFEQIDPLFVVDLNNVVSPKIIGKLVIPGFSRYLHPYAPINQGVQYLLGLGYNTSTNQRGGVTTSGVKIDLYKVNFNDVRDSMISVQQLGSKTIGGQGSFSPAIDNPRTFVWDDVAKKLLLPLSSSRYESVQQCSVQYDLSGKELSKLCYPTTTNVTDFVGIKGFTIDTQGNVTENISRNYATRTGESLDVYTSRVGFLGNIHYFINGSFVDFFVGDGGVSSSSKIIEFSGISR